MYLEFKQSIEYKVYVEYKLYVSRIPPTYVYVENNLCKCRM